MRLGALVGTSLAVVTLITAASGVAHAEEPATAAQKPVDEQKSDDRAERAKFSGGRYAVEALTGAVVGSLVAYGTYKGVCGDKPCIGGALGGLALNIAVTPAAVYGVGNVMGGEGSLGTTYLGGLIAFSGGSAAPQAPALGLIIGTILLPFTAALGYEFSSSMAAQQMKKVGVDNVRLNVDPLTRGDRVVGATAGVTASF